MTLLIDDPVSREEMSSLDCTAIVAEWCSSPMSRLPSITVHVARLMSRMLSPYCHVACWSCAVTHSCM